MRVLITGANGFLGRSIISVFQKEHEIETLSRKNSTYNFDLSKGTPRFDSYFNFVIHVAGKAHVLPKNKKEEKKFFEVNLEGTKNLLQSLTDNLPNTFVYISTVAVYGKEFGENIDENTILNGGSAYAKSKILAEAEVLAFGEKYDVNIVILRLPLVIGKSPKGNLKSLMKAVKKGYYFRIGKGLARRSMVLAIDIADVITRLYGKHGIYNLTDRRNPRFRDIDSKISDGYGKKIKVMPDFLIKVLAKAGDFIPGSPINSYKYKKMTNSLTFSDDKAVKELNWSPRNSLDFIE